MSFWANEIELREESGSIRAYRTRDNREIPIPSFPRPTVDMFEWLTYLSTDALEAARQYYLDHWTWDTNEERYLVLVAHIASEIDERAPPWSRPGRTTLDFTKN